MPNQKPAILSAVIVALLTLIAIIAVPTETYYRSLGGYTSFGVQVENRFVPVHFSEYLRKFPFTGRIFNHPTDGGYLQLKNQKLTIYGDSRFVDPALVDQYFEASFNPQAFATLDQSYQFDGFLLYLAGKQYNMFQLVDSQQWKMVYADLHRAFFIKASSEEARTRPVVLDFYKGEDLSIVMNGMCAMRWIWALGNLNRPDLVLLALNDFAEAKLIPAPVLQFSLEFAIKAKHEEIARRAAELTPKLLAHTSQESQAVFQLLSDPWLKGLK